MRDNKVFTDSGFKSSDWQYFTDQFKILSGKSYAKSIIESKYSEQKKKFVALKTVLSLSGFGIDPASGVPTAPKAVLDAYIEAHPRKYKDCSPENMLKILRLQEAIRRSYLFISCDDNYVLWNLL